MRLLPIPLEKTPTKTPLEPAAQLWILAGFEHRE